MAKKSAKKSAGSKSARGAKAPKRPAAKSSVKSSSAKRTPAKKLAAKSAPAKRKAAGPAVVANKAVLPTRRKIEPARPLPAPKTARKPARPPQRFVTSHLTDASFAEGLRAYAQYRDLGIGGATGGLVQAHVIRFVPPCRPEEVSKLHYHDVEFQMVYVLKGWIRSEFEGEGAHTFAAGACWIQPPRIKHKVLDYSDDCEVLEIVMPADFGTVTLD